MPRQFVIAIILSRVSPLDNALSPTSMEDKREKERKNHSNLRYVQVQSLRKGHEGHEVALAWRSCGPILNAIEYSAAYSHETN